ncbi:MAG: hypothetical protein ACLFR1_07260 [Spirochaetia bacterium]
MGIEQQKAQAFVTRLISNPSLQGLNALQKEEQIMQFLHVNSRQLAPTLMSPSFFPGKNWNQVYKILITALFDLINKELFPFLEAIVREKIDYQFIQHIRQQNASHKSIQDELLGFLQKILAKNEVRRLFTGPCTALQYSVTEKYLEAAFSRKEYVHFELIKVQRLKMSKENIQDLIRVSLLIRPAVGMLSTEQSSQHEQMTGLVQQQYAEKVIQVVKNQLRTIPEAVIKSGINSNLSFEENRFVEATARIVSIFSSRCKNYRPNIKVDRGADTPDKSWFSIARRNYKFYGFDIKMLDEFYKVAAENGL